MKRILVILLAIVLFASCSRVSGTYVNESGGLYDQIEFVGNSPCNITTLGMKFPATYRIDNGGLAPSAPVIYRFFYCSASLVLEYELTFLYVLSLKKLSPTSVLES